MYNILEDLECVVCGGYTIRLNHIDSDSECISIIEDSITTTDKELVRVGDVLKSEVQFYIVSKRGLYNKALSDMIDIGGNIHNLLYKELGNKYILDVEVGKILNLGVDKGFDNVSLNVVITYKILR